MTPWTALLRGAWTRLAGFVWRRNVDARLNEEMRFHVDMSAAREARTGLPDHEARRHALVAFGARERFREEARDAVRSRLLHDLTQDLRYAVRGLRKRSAPASVIVLTLSLGIGALTTVFSVVNSVLLVPLPYPEADLLATVWQHWEKRDAGPASISPAEYFDYLDQQRVFSAFGVYTTDVTSLTGDGDPVQLPTAYVSHGVFAAIGVAPALGRLINARDDQPSGSDVVVLTHGLWQRRFGGTRDVVGRRIIVGRQSVTIIGVLPEGFRLPDELSAASPAELFAPLALTRAGVLIRGSHYLSSVARLKPSVTMAQAASGINGLARGFVTRLPGDYPEHMRFGATLKPLQDSIVGSARSRLLLLLVAVGGVLLIACVNATSLLLAQAESRRREIAVRSALGASRSRVVRQLLVESVLLASLALGGGLLLTTAATRALIALDPVGLPRLNSLRVDASVLLFAFVISALTALASGLVPALQLVRGDVQPELRGSGRSVTAGLAQRRIRRVLVAGEMAIAIVLLLGAGLLTTSFARLLAVDPGFAVEHVVTLPITLPQDSAAGDEGVIAFFTQLTERIRLLPDVRAAGAVAGAPLVAPRGDIGILLEGRTVPMGATKPHADWQVITPGYLGAIGMHLKRGRDIAGTDQATTPGVVVINETMARRLWPGDDALGKRFTLGGGTKPGLVTVVGIVGDVHQAGLDAVPDMEMYIPHAQFRFWGGGGILRSLSVVVNSPQELAALVQRLRDVVRTLAPAVPIGTMRTMQQVRSASVAQPRFMMVLFLMAAAIAFVIAVVGLYGVVAYYVAQRRREFGMRVALGAGRRDIARLVLREGFVITVAGVGVGVPAALAFARLLEGFLFGVRATDPVLLIAIPATLAIVAIAASYVPARRAARTDPMLALRID